MSAATVKESVLKSLVEGAKSSKSSGSSAQGLKAAVKELMSAFQENDEDAAVKALSNFQKISKTEDN